MTRVPGSHGGAAVRGVRPGPLLVGVAAIVLVWVTADVLLGGPLTKLDHLVSETVLRSRIWYARRPHRPLFWVRHGLQAMCDLGARDTALVLVTPLVAWFAWRRRTWRPVFRLAVGVALLALVVYGGKVAFGRMAPPTDGMGSALGRSFPSGHVATAVLCWGVAAWLAVEYGGPRWLRASLVALSRAAPAATFAGMLLLDYHWLTDVVAGGALGILLLRALHGIDAVTLRDWPGERGRRRGTARTATDPSGDLPRSGSRPAPGASPRGGRGSGADDDPPVPPEPLEPGLPSAPGRLPALDGRAAPGRHHPGTSRTALAGISCLLLPCLTAGNPSRPSLIPPRAATAAPGLTAGFPDRPSRIRPGAATAALGPPAGSPDGLSLIRTGAAAAALGLTAGRQDRPPPIRRSAAATAGRPGRTTEPAAGTPYRSTAPARVMCTISDRRITESSGLVAAGHSLYTINDGGDRLRVFVLDRSCRVRRVIENRLNPYDVEDLGRSPDGTLWLADIGDNDAARRTVAVELLSESGEATLFRFIYPDGPHDAEALLLDRRGRPYLVTKEVLSARVYTPARTPTADRPTPLSLVTTLALRPTGTSGGPVGAVSQVLVTGGAVAPDGTRFALRTYTDAYVWSEPGGDLAAALRSGTPRRIALPPTRQGEAIAFSVDGRTLLTSTEGRPAPVHAVPLGDTDPAPTRSPATGSPAATDPSSGGAPSGIANILLAVVLAGALVWGGSKAINAIRR